jgi:hypothetical protein
MESMEIILLSRCWDLSTDGNIIQPMKSFVYIIIIFQLVNLYCHNEPCRIRINRNNGDRDCNLLSKVKDNEGQLATE